MQRRNSKRLVYLIYQSTQHITMLYINLRLTLTLIHTTTCHTTITTGPCNFIILHCVIVQEIKKMLTVTAAILTSVSNSTALSIQALVVQWRDTCIPIWQLPEMPF